jgi:hypothetical protein
MYDTTYNFEPPKSENGRVCIYQCENGRMQCGQLEQMRLDNCNARSESQRYSCEQDIRYRLNRSPKWYECGGESCSDETSRCDEQYRACFQACGGRVIAETRCIANCPVPGAGTK